MTPSEAPKALQASECSELLDPTRANCWISAQHQPGKFNQLFLGLAMKSLQLQHMYLALAEPLPCRGGALALHRRSPLLCRGGAPCFVEVNLLALPRRILIHKHRHRHRHRHRQIMHALTLAIHPELSTSVNGCMLGRSPHKNCKNDLDDQT